MSCEECKKEECAATEPAAAAAAAAAAAPAEEKKGPSKNELKKQAAKAKKLAAKQAAKEKREAEQKARQAAKAAEDAAEDAPDAPGMENFQKLPMNQSGSREGKTYTNLCDLTKDRVGESVVVQARVHNVRGMVNIAFVVLRQGIASVQAVVERVPGAVPRAAVKFVKALTAESLVEVWGVVAAAKVDSCTQHDVELRVTKCLVVSRAEAPLPIQLEDCSRPQPLFRAQKAAIREIQARIDEFKRGKSAEELAASPAKEELEKLQAECAAAHKYVKPDQDTRLNNRVLDLRTPANHAIFRIQSGVCQLFREYLLQHDFVEIHTPKLIECASEGGCNVFEVKYFDRKAYLAQSPQLYKQMAITADLDRVFEIGSIFRAEKSFTRRHLTEFIGLDLEMAFHEHYHEVLDVLEGLFVYIFEGLQTRFKSEIAAVSQQYPVRPIKVTPVKRILFKDAVALLREDGKEMGDFDDFSTPLEVRLGEIIREKYDTDFYIIDQFPAAVRPFYTMPNPTDPRYSNSFDVFLRGQEITSGAQRIHDPEFLTQNSLAKGVDPATIRAYIDSFRWGAPPHAGAGIGLERVVMLFLGLGNIRKTTMFPRDPSRLSP